MFFLKYYKSFLIGFCVLLLSLLPVDTTQHFSVNIPHFDKLVHFFMYFFLTASLLIETKNSSPKAVCRLVLSIIISVFIFGGIVELIQEVFIPGRFGSFFDLAANCLGAIVSAIFFCKTSIFSGFLRGS